MTIKKIRSELKQIYQEMKGWDGSKGPFTEAAIRYRELVLIKQQLLYKIEEARSLDNKFEESFSYSLYNLINKFSQELKKELKNG
ncbi:MAG: hypothetical protein ACP5MG_10305 [Verrucomicrobiia bacterium]